MLELFLHKLKDTGVDGFEGLVARLLKDLTGFDFLLARSGSQHGRDGQALDSSNGSIVFECKNYATKNIGETEISGKIVESCSTIADLDLWILCTSKLVSAQLVDKLTQISQRLNIDFLVLDTQEESCGRLDVLCAGFKETVLRHFRRAGLKDCLKDLDLELDQIARSCKIDDEVHKLQIEVQTSIVGLCTLRKQTREKWLEAVNDKKASKEDFGQIINVLSQDARFVERRKFEQELNKWWHNWNNSKNIEIVLGDEGVGKSWAVAYWLSKRMTKSGTFPPVLYFSAKDVTETGRLEDLLIRKLKPYNESKNWLVRFKRWTKRQHRDNLPAAVLVFDGLNERPNDFFWRSLLSQISAGEWKESVAVILIARTSYWKEHFVRDEFEVEELCLGEFNTSELKKALALRGLKLSNFPPDVHSVMRKPRYFNLAIKYAHLSPAGNDFSLARLVYSDWSDRWAAKTSTSLTQRQFDELLIDIARDAYSGKKAWKRGELESKLGVDSARTFLELSTSGILKPTDFDWCIDDDRLALGLAFLLCTVLSKEIVSIDDEIAVWIEPLAGMAFQPKILEFAFLHASKTELSEEIRSALLYWWLEAQNQNYASEGFFIARLEKFLDVNVEVYFNVVERFWKETTNNAWAQELLMKAMVNWINNSDEFKHKFKKRAVRWLGIVPLNGAPMHRRSDQAETNVREIHEQLVKTFGDRIWKENVRINHHGFTFSFTVDDGLLRLSRVALALISTMPIKGRQECFKLLIAAVVTESVFDSPFYVPEKLSIVQWILRSTCVNLDQEFLPLVEPLAASSDPILKKAAESIYSVLGTQKSLSKLTNSSRLRNNDKVRSLSERFKLDSVELEQYLQSSDFNVRSFLQFSKPHIHDHAMHFLREDLKTLIISELRKIDPKKFYSSDHSTSEHFQFSQFELAFTRICPKETAEFLREAISHGCNKDSLTAKTALHEINDFELLLNVRAREDLAQIWQSKEKKLLREAELEEAILFEMTLPLWKGTEQLNRIRARGAQRHILYSFTYFLDTKCSGIIEVPTEPLLQLVVLHQILRSPNLTLTQTALQHLLEKGDSQTRGLTLRYCYERDLDPIFAVWIDRFDAQKGHALDTSEIEYATLLLLRHQNQLGSDFVKSKLPSALVGYGLKHLSSQSEEWKKYAASINETIEIMSTFEIPSSFPKITIIGSDDLPTENHSIKIEQPEENQSFFITQPEFTWGGQHASRGFERDQTNKQVDKLWKKRSEALSNAIKKAISKGHYWLGAEFNTAGIVEAIFEDPAILEDWIKKLREASDSNFLLSSRTFYQSLCIALFETNQFQGEVIELYELLGQSPSQKNVIVKYVKLPKVDIALFSKRRTLEIEKLWQRKLDTCISDRDLLEFALLIRFTNNNELNDWLLNQIQNNLESSIPFFRARAIAIQGFLGADFWIPIEIENVETWEAKVNAVAEARKNQEANMKHWFSSFLEESDDDIAWSAFRLFLSVVDRRCWLWMEKEVNESSISSEKERFLSLNRRKIEIMAERKERQYAKDFLCCSCDHNVSPWLTFGDRLHDGRFKCV